MCHQIIITDRALIYNSQWIIHTIWTKVKQADAKRLLVEGYGLYKTV